METRLASASPMEIVDERLLKSVRSKRNVKSIATYAERWARLMQLDMSKGQKLEDVAKATSYEADLEGMSGNSYAYAVELLARCWAHGEQLRRWHNLDTQLGNEGEHANEEGGVLNPSLLVIDITNA